MNSGNPFGAAIAFFIFMQVVWSLALLGGGLYVLWCLNRIASSVERLANAREKGTTAPDAPLATPHAAPQFVPTSPLFEPSSSAQTSAQVQRSAPLTELPPLSREVPPS